MWVDRGTYWLNDAKQGTEEWKSLRKGLLTASKFSVASGFIMFQTKENLALCMRYGVDYIPQHLELQLQIETDASKLERLLSLERMKHGNDTESLARDWYCKHYNCTVKEVGLAVPKWDMRIGCSLDGEVESDGMIEIKCPPEKMYAYILQYLQGNSNPLFKEEKKIEKWDKIYQNYYWYVLRSHYDQMQGCMAITNKKWCDYIVYSVKDNMVFVKKIYFDPVYWNEHLYPSLCTFLEERN